MGAGREIIVRNNPSPEIITKLKEHAGSESVFRIRVSSPGSLRSISLDGYPAVVFFKHDGSLRFGAEVAQRPHSEGKIMMLSNAQEVEIESWKLLENESKIAQKHGSVGRFLQKLGYNPRNQKLSTKRSTRTPSESTQRENSDRSASVSNNSSNGSVSESPGDQVPSTSETTVERVNRDQQIVSELKEDYSYSCQVCSEKRYKSTKDAYAEGHHIKPLRPDGGPDIKNNMLVLCPNHHQDFEAGMIRIDPATHEITHPYERDLDGTTLTVHDDHRIKQYLKYHNRNRAKI